MGMLGSAWRLMMRTQSWSAALLTDRLTEEEVLYTCADSEAVLCTCADSESENNVILLSVLSFCLSDHLSVSLFFPLCVCFLFAFTG